MKLGLFRRIVEMIRKTPQRRIDREVVLDTLAILLPSEDLEKTFDNLVTWGRQGDLPAYDEDEPQLWIQHESPGK